MQGGQKANDNIADSSHRFVSNCAIQTAVADSFSDAGKALSGTDPARQENKSSARVQLFH